MSQEDVKDTDYITFMTDNVFIAMGNYLYGMLSLASH